ncbi:hypothetical protein P7C71_g727, partial [Lecanoromycetidae sp. Uapishka_2]
MSLRVDGRHSRGRSKSPGRKDERSRSRDVRAPSPAVVIKKTVEKYSYKESDSDSHSRKKKKSAKYDSSSSSDSDSRSKKKSSKKRRDSDSDSSVSDSRYKKKSSRRHREDSDSDSKHKKKSSKKHYSDSDSDSRAKKKSHKKHHDDSDSTSSSSEDDRKSRRKSETALVRTKKGEYIETSRGSKYEHERRGSHIPDHHEHRPAEYTRHMSNSSIESGEKYPQPQTIARLEGYRTHSGSNSSQGPEYYQYADQGRYGPNGRKPSYTQTVHPQYQPPPSPPKLHRLSVSGGAAGAMLGLAAPGQHVSHMQGGLPPGSPLLEAYRGTYQSISPMPSPMMLPSTMDESFSDLEPLSAEDSDDADDHHRSTSTLKKKSRKTVSFYDPEPDALALAAALKHSTPDHKPVLKILPHLSDDHILMLRTEYKKHMKAQGKGVNIAKHVKVKLTGNLGKVAYATALGRWESEAHWANFWYQSNTSRRELLIESLMGRTNSEIVKIKDAFSDQRYNNSLEKCMQTELKKDKFRNAVLLALEERRMDNSDKLSIDQVRRDAQDLYRALTAKEGGETAMINIIVVRSDRHLAEVLRTFEGLYKKNFAREMIKKSQNLVGETLAHILNGVLNRPVRDALLLHQALAETSKDRSDLLVSRLVRFHWEPTHMERIKVAYKQKYGTKLESAIDEGTKGEFGDFCVALCKVEI